MSVQNSLEYDFAVNGLSPTAGNVAIAAGSTSSTPLPANVEYIALVATVPCRFRLSVGASTAVATDPLIAANQTPLIVKINTSQAITISTIQEGAVTGLLSFCRAYEA